MKTVIAIASLFLFTSAAHADCAFSTGKCSTDNRGNTYRTEQNLVGSYSTTKNGVAYSTTEQTLGGGYRETSKDGGYRTYNYNPNADLQRNTYGYR